jgi:hypothetical protein
MHGHGKLEINFGIGLVFHSVSEWNMTRPTSTSSLLDCSGTGRRSICTGRNLWEAGSSLQDPSGHEHSSHTIVMLDALHFVTGAVTPGVAPST